jgi:hypothetical protein
MAKTNGTDDKRPDYIFDDHYPCPKCGGWDTFVQNKKDGSRTYYCRTIIDGQRCAIHQTTDYVILRDTLCQKDKTVRVKCRHVVPGHEQGKEEFSIFVCGHKFPVKGKKTPKSTPNI